MTPPVRSGPPPDSSGVGDRRRSSAPAWTGGKRRKTVGARSLPGLGSSSSDEAAEAMLIDHNRSQIQEDSSSSDDATEAMLLDGNRYQIQEEEEGEQAREDLVSSAEEDLDEEELSRYCQELKSREPPFIYVLFATKLCRREERQELYQRFTQFRLTEFKLLAGDSLNSNETANTGVLTYSEDSDEVQNFENPHGPCHSMFGWSIDHESFYISDLDDYQRIVPTRTDNFEYAAWDKYRLMFSKFETDEEYVQYWDELFEKIKWIGEYLHLEYKEFDIYRVRGLRQAMKIAASFRHLPYSLAIFGYNEYVRALEHDSAYGKGYVRAHLELWKRVSKGKMSFNEALSDILTLDYEFPSRCLDMIKSAIMGYGAHMEHHFFICMNHIREHIVDGDDDDDDDTVLKHINDALYPEIGRPKMYVDYAKKKLLVARRIGFDALGIGRGPQDTKDQTGWLS